MIFKNLSTMVPARCICRVFTLVAFTFAGGKLTAHSEGQGKVVIGIS